MFQTADASLPRRRLLQGVAAYVCLASTSWAKATQFEEITWEALVPPDWDPMQSFHDLQELAALPDTDERVQELYDRMRKVWDKAPIILSLDGREVKLPGFIVPLEAGKKGIREFLLVPYFGACIHTPPPPANQIIHVRANPPVRGFETMSAVWVSGTLGLERSHSEWGMSGYSMKAARVEEYKER